MLLAKLLTHPQSNILLPTQDNPDSVTATATVLSASSSNDYSKNGKKPDNRHGFGGRYIRLISGGPQH